MKLALISDIHANLQAFDAVLEHAAGQGVGRVAVLGDSVGYGGDPSAVVQRLMALSATGAWVVKGNHDAAAVSPPPRVGADGRPASAQDLGAHWTHDQLDGHERAYLDQLPLTVCEPPCLLVHASADAPAAWRYVEDEQVADASLRAACAQPGVRYVFGGHVHRQCLFYRGSGRSLMRFDPHPGTPIPVPSHRQWLATVGSAGQPRDGDPRAMYAVLDTAAEQLCFHRVPYDHIAAAAAIRGSGLPGWFAERLEHGR